MSTAHRPTWDPAQARDVKGGSRQFSVRDMAAHTKLKFRQPGQTSVGDVARRDLRAELLIAEEEARNKKRKAEGKPPLFITGGGNANGSGTETQDEESSKRRKLLEEALELDKDDDDEDDEDDKKSGNEEAGKENGDADEESAVPLLMMPLGLFSEEEEEEDDTDELLRELEKIKRERAEEKARVDREQSASQAAAREAEIATSNPLLNLAAALGQAPGVNTTVPGTFSVKRRWDDGEFFELFFFAAVFTKSIGG
ncbi:hypothetical protein PAXINDRAFT_155626 [Paxillus involutus ATCC 200175]|uniref:Cwf15/Cwc15 cell cycle control protein n=1 Tax=Paxillus involutus ATCC 200175 TaxID=664439 RepID=A0A0C9U8I0_PAXIN|nr:hypothetical protein PAXINDRAFT_155626 [Paxillus involutus ATCC 200175]